MNKSEISIKKVGKQKNSGSEKYSNLNKKFTRGFKGGFDQVEEYVNLKRRQWKYYNEFEEHKEKRLKKSKQSLRDLWDTIKQTSICIVRVPEGEEKDAERIFGGGVVKG